MTVVNNSEKRLHSRGKLSYFHSDTFSLEDLELTIISGFVTCVDVEIGLLAS